jgi:16S rRNA processing protein RimM
MIWDAMVTVGRIIRPQGNRGEVVIAPETDFGPERFRPGGSLQTMRNDLVHTLIVGSSREHQGRWVVGFEGIENIGQAESLRGLELRIPAEALKALGDGRHYVHDLVGCRVETSANEVVGTVDSVHFGAGPPLLVVEGATGEVLVPLNEAICQRVDIEAKVIVIAPPEGLVELNETAESRQKAQGTRHK